MLWRHEAYGVVAFLSGWTIFTSLGGFGQEQASYLDWTSFGLMVVLSFSWFYFSQRLPSLLFSWLFLFFSGLSLFLLVSYDGFLWPVWSLFLLVPVLWLVREESNRRIVEMVYLVVAAISSIVYLSVRAESNAALPSMTEAILLAIVSIGLGIFLYQNVTPYCLSFRLDSLESCGLMNRPFYSLFSLNYPRYCICCIKNVVMRSSGQPSSISFSFNSRYTSSMRGIV